MKRVSLALILVLLLSVEIASHAAGATPNITGITPNKLVSFDSFYVVGTDFETREKNSKLKLQFDNQTFTLEIISWNSTEIQAKAPLFHSTTGSKQAKITVFRDEKTFSNEFTKETELYFNDNINQLVLMKKAGLSDQFILGQLDAMINQRNGFHNNVHSPDVVILKKAGFNDEIISSIAGHPQHVNVGLSGIWLNDTADFVGATMIRIFIFPRSYFSSVYFRKPKNIFDLYMDFVKRIDLNIGYTITKSGKEDEKKKDNYLLVGYSYEINRSALLNVGVALLPGDITGDKRQAYFGITLDENFLKDVGILNKK